MSTPCAERRENKRREDAHTHLLGLVILPFAHNLAAAHDVEGAVVHGEPQRRQHNAALRNSGKLHEVRKEKRRAGLMK